MSFGSGHNDERERSLVHSEGSIVKMVVGSVDGSGIEAMTKVVLLENFFTAIFETCGGFPHCFRNIIAFPLNVL